LSWLLDAGAAGTNTFLHCAAAVKSVIPHHLSVDSVARGCLPRDTDNGSTACAFVPRRAQRAGISHLFVPPVRFHTPLICLMWRIACGRRRHALSRMHGHRAAYISTGLWPSTVTTTQKAPGHMD
jgi:hypothetical protein